MSKKFKIALITYQYGYNEGTLLQAYATARLLRERLAEAIVDVVDWRHPLKEKITFSRPRNAREKSLREFFETHLENKGRIIRSSHPKPVFKEVSRNYHLVVVGSDEVWRLDYQWVRRFGLKYHKQPNPWAPPFPNIYWPNAKDLGIPCVSLASSISEMNQVELIPQHHLEKIRASLSEFKLISVRDTRSRDFIESIIEGVEPCWLPDPTFSLPNATPDQLANLRTRLNLQVGGGNAQKIALVNCHVPLSSLHDVVNSCKNMGYLVVGMSHHVEGADINLSEIAIGPFDWAAIPALANLLITDRFHGAVFALKNNVPVIALDHRNQISGSESKIRDLLGRFGLLSYWFPVNDGTVADLSELNDRIKNIQTSWPGEAVKYTCLEFSKRLVEFIDGPLTELISNIRDRARA